MQSQLAEMGYRPCVGFRDPMLTYKDLGKELIDFCNDHGLLWYWHPPHRTAAGIGKTGKLTEHLKAVGESAGYLAEEGMQYLLIHPDAALYDLPPELTGPELYYSRITAGQMWRFLENHIDPGRELSAMCNQRLLWENVHDSLYRETENSFYTYYAAQAGYLETSWLAKVTFAGVAFDSEHYYGSLELHRRWGIHSDLSIPPDRLLKRSEALFRLTGYYLIKGYAPYEPEPSLLTDVIGIMKPKIFHLGGGTSLVNTQGQSIGPISFDLRRRSQKQILLHQIAWIEKHGGWLEAENEGRERDFRYSPRITSDRQAKKRCFWQAVKAIEKYRAGAWVLDPSFII